MDDRIHSVASGEGRVPRSRTSNACILAAVLLSACSGVGTQTIQNPLLLQSTAGADAGTDVDRVAHSLETVATVPIDNWKAAPALRGPWALQGDPARPDFDAQGWREIKLGAPIDLDSFWLRKELTLPAQMLGRPVAGTVKLKLSITAPGDLWINGESKGAVGRDTEVELTQAAKPGARFVVALKIPPPKSTTEDSKPRQVRLSRAEIVLEQGAKMRQQLEDVALSLRVAQKLLSFDTYQTSARNTVDPKLDKSTFDRAERARLYQLLQTLATQITAPASYADSFDGFEASMRKVREQLGPIRDFVQQFTLYFDANAHIDAAWLWREKETVEVVKNTFASVLNMMNKRPDFTYTQSAAAYYDWLERLYPDVFKGIQQRVKDGRWEVVGGLWVESDCNLPSGESWARHLLYAKRYFRNKLGADVKIGWNPDSFGYNWSIPMFFSQAGVDSFVTQKISWNDTNVFPYRVFWWESADGSKVLTYFPFNYVNRVDNPFRLVDWLRQFESNTGFRKLLILFGVGDHGGGPSLEMIDRIERLKTIDLFPRIEYGTAGTYIDWLKKQDLRALPSWRDELYLEYHRGTYTTQARTKEFNRTAEVLLTNAEKFSSLATQFGRPYNSSSLEEAWRDVLFNQFHDILPGSSIHEVYKDSTERHERSRKLAGLELTKSLEKLSENINTSFVRGGIPIVVFNALSWSRTDLVVVPLSEGDTGDYAIFDRTGAEMPSQIQQKTPLNRSVLFVAKDVPSIGYSVFELRRKAPAAKGRGLSVSEQALENDLFRIAIDDGTGTMKSLIDKRDGKELLSGHGNELQLLEDKPTQYDAWEIGLTGVSYPSHLRKIEVVERGPVRSTIRITRDFLRPGVKKGFPTEDFPSSFFTQEISLYETLDRIDFKTDVDWWEEHTMLKVAFPLAIQDDQATYDIPYGTIRRSTQARDSWEKAKDEVYASRWADLSDDQHGVSVLTKAKYGYDIKGNIIRLSLLRSPKSPDPLADRGKHSIEYALYPHSGRVERGYTLHRGYEYNNSLIPIRAGIHRGQLPASHSFVALGPANLVLTTIKKAEDDNAWVVQWYNTQESDSNAKLTLPRSPSKVVRSNFLETNGSAVESKGSRVNVPTKKRSVETVKAYF